MTTELLPPEHLNKLIGGYTAEDYRSIGEHFLDVFSTLGGLKSTDRVLDVGCGCGRMALPLTEYLTTGSYEGFDIVSESVDWCRQNITNRFPAFRFQWADIYNAEYNKTSAVKAKDYRFPYSDASFDFVFLTSVFTHMLREDVEHYVREIARTLKLTGTAVITFFILNEESERLMKAPESQVQIPYAWEDEGIRVADLATPEAVIGYPEALVRQILPTNGLALQEPIHFGSWCGRINTVTFQDLTISKKQQAVSA